MAKTNPAVLRVSAILNLLSRHSERALSLSEIARRLDINKSTAHSLLHTMESVGFLARSEEGGYSLGRDIIGFGQAALGNHRAIALARREVEHISSETGLHCVAAVTSGDEIVVIANSYPLGSRLGFNTPLVPPFGGIFYAWSSEQEIESWLNRAGSLNAAERDNLLRGLENIRMVGYQVAYRIDRGALHSSLAKIEGRDYEQRRAEVIRKIVGDISTMPMNVIDNLKPDQPIWPDFIAAPLFDNSGRVALAFMLYGFTRPLTSADISRMVKQLWSTAAEISRISYE